MAAWSGADSTDQTHSYAFARGIAAFGGTILATAGVFHFIEGLSAASNDDEFIAPRNYIFDFNLTSWGWIHIIIGVIAAAVGVAIVLGRTWGYGIGIAIAALSALASFAFLPYYPIWGLVTLVFDVVVIWALYRAMVPAGRPMP